MLIWLWLLQSQNLPSIRYSALSANYHLAGPGGAVGVESALYHCGTLCGLLYLYAADGEVAYAEYRLVTVDAVHVVSAIVGDHVEGLGESVALDSNGSGVIGLGRHHTDLVAGYLQVGSAGPDGSREEFYSSGGAEALGALVVLEEEDSGSHIQILHVCE